MTEIEYERVFKNNKSTKVYSEFTEDWRAWDRETKKGENNDNRNEKLNWKQKQTQAKKSANSPEMTTIMIAALTVTTNRQKCTGLLLYQPELLQVE